MGIPSCPVLAAVHRQVSPEQFRLCTFDRDEARCVATAIVGELHASHFEDVFDRSGGNAFLLEELLASPSGVLPQGVQDVVLARLDTLSAAAVLVAEAASLETTVARDTLAGITAQSPLKLAAALDELCERGFLEARGMTYTFRHPLIREAVESRIQPGRLALLHGRLAEELERHEPARLGEIARHWFEAGDRPKALAASIEAGQRARRGGAWPEAADQFERALSLWDQLPQSDRPDVTSLALTDWHGRLALVSYAEVAMQHAAGSLPPPG